MNTKHTPGPWIVTEGDEWTSDVHTEDESNGKRTVASCNTHRDEVDANKRLIAAAPELLEALQQCELIMGHGGGMQDTVDRARAAIAKATGETP